MTGIFAIPGVPAGRLAILTRPRFGQVEEAARQWRDAGLTSIVSLLEDAEAASLGLAGEAEACTTTGLRFMQFPLLDGEVPSSAEQLSELVDSLTTALRSGSSIGVHCRMGIGRSAVVATCVLVTLGVPLERAWALVQKGRGVSVPHTPWQREWVAEWADERGGQSKRQA